MPSPLVLNEHANEVPMDVIHQMAVDKILESLGPFWIETVIPVILCLVVVLLLSSMLAVALILVREFGESDASLYKSFDSAGFEEMWARNAKAVIDEESNVAPIDSDTSLNSPIEVVSLVPVNAGHSVDKINLEHCSHGDMPDFPPRPAAASNSDAIRKAAVL